MNLFSLKWKETFRAPQWEAKLSVKVIIALLMLYFIGAFVFFSSVIYPILFKEVLDREPLEVFNSVLLYVFFGELVIRFFIQELPVTKIQSLILLPIKKRRIVNHVLLRSILSGFNTTPFIFYLPFAVSMYRDDYLPSEILTWWTALLLMTLSINFLSYVVHKSWRFFAFLLSFIAGTIFLAMHTAISPARIIGKAFDAVIETPMFLVGFVALMIGAYSLVFFYLEKGFYLDANLGRKKEKIRGADLAFLNVFSSNAIFLKNDLRMIVRNARPRQVALMSFLFLFYGLIFFTQEMYRDMQFVLVFAGLFVTGGFMMTFGNFVPAWDSQYYKLLMTQNISYKNYLLSKWNLMVFVTGLSLVLSLPYLYFGVDIYAIIMAGALFNMGLGSWITLLGGLLNKTPMKLNVKAKAFENTQGFSLKQGLLIFPKMVLPIFLYWLPATLISPLAGYLVLGGAGVTGIFLKDRLADWITTLYVKQKHETLEAFNK